MKQANHLNATLERILHFDFSKGNIASRANAALLEEYLRREVLWGEAAGCPWKWMFGDYAECINPSVRAPEEALERVKNHLKYGDIVQTSCINALHWAALKDIIDLEVVYDLPDLFEPLLVLYGRGGSFVIRHGFFEIGGVSIHIGDNAKEKFKGIKPLLSLDKVTLDTIDKGE